MLKKISAALCVAMLFNTATTGLATADPPATEVQKAMRRCALTVAGTTALGALFGAATGGRRNSGRSVFQGGAIGAAVGAGFCGVMLKMANDADKAKIAAAQQQAAESGVGQDVSYVGDDGASRRIQVSVRDAPPMPPTAATGSGATAAPIPCRYTDTTVTVSGAGQANVPSQLVCRTADGQWLPQSVAST